MSLQTEDKITETMTSYEIERRLFIVELRKKFDDEWSKKIVDGYKKAGLNFNNVVRRKVITCNTCKLTKSVKRQLNNNTPLVVMWLCEINKIIKAASLTHCLLRSHRPGRTKDQKKYQQKIC